MYIIFTDNVGKFYRYVNSKLDNTKTVHSTKIGESKYNLTDNLVEQDTIINDYFGCVFTPKRSTVYR